MVYLKRYSESVAILSNLIHMYPAYINTIPYIELLRQMSYMEEKQRKTIEKKYLKNHDIDTYKFINNADKFFEQQKYDEAIANYDKALAMEPYNTGALFNKGLCYFNLQNYKEALYWYGKVLEIDPRDIDAIKGKGMCILILYGESEANEFYSKNSRF